MSVWTKEEVTLLKQNMDNCLYNLQKLFPQKSEDQILEKIRLLYRVKNDKTWTEGEIKIIVDNHKLSIVKLMKLLPNRSYEAIRFRRYTMGYGYGSMQRIRVSEEELQDIIEYRKEGYTNYEIADMLNRPLGTVMNIIYNKRLIKRRSFKGRHIWTEEELSALKDMVNKQITVEKIAEHFKTDVNKIKIKAIHLGYSHGDLNTEFKVKRVPIRKEEAKELKYLRRYTKRLEKQLLNK